MRAFVVAAALVILSCSANATDAVLVHNGWIKGNDFLRFDDARQRGYLIGVIDGMFLAPLFGGDTKSWLEPCMAKHDGMDDAKRLPSG